MLIETLCTIPYILPYPRFPALITLMSAKQQPWESNVA